MKKRGALLLAALLFWAGAAQAVAYKNPAHRMKQGQFNMGLLVDKQTRELEFEVGGKEDVDFSSQGLSLGIGVGKAGALNINFLTTEWSNEDSLDGGEGSIVYRHNLGGKEKIKTGFLLAYQGGYVEHSSGDFGVEYRIINFGFGGAAPIEKNLSAYGGLVLSTLTGEAWATGTDTTWTVESTNNFGAFAGLEMLVDKSGVVGLELHLINESGFALYFELTL